MKNNSLFQNPKALHNRKRLRNNTTETEDILWSRLRKRCLEGYRFTRQYSVGKYILDFYCPQFQLAIEVDGGQHNEEKTKIYDQKRTDFLMKQGIEIIRFWNNDIYQRIDDVCDEILFHLRKKTPKFGNHPPLQP